MTKDEVFAALQTFRPGCQISWRNEKKAIDVAAFFDIAKCRHSGFVLQFFSSGEFDPEFDLISFGTKFSMLVPMRLEQVNELNSAFRLVRHFWDGNGLVVTLDAVAPSAVLVDEVFEQNYALFDSALDRIQMMAGN